MRLTRLFFLLFIILPYTCKQNSNKHTLDSIIKVIGPVAEEKTVVIIPNTGCEGCITEAERFVITNYNKLINVSYIFTQIHSLKLLRLRLGDSVLSNSRVRLDSKNEIIYPEQEKEIYPMIVYFDGNRIEKIDYQSPYSSGFQNLLNYKK